MILNHWTYFSSLRHVVGNGNFVALYVGLLKTREPVEGCCYDTAWCCWCAGTKHKSIVGIDPNSFTVNLKQSPVNDMDCCRSGGWHLYYWRKMSLQITSDEWDGFLSYIGESDLYKNHVDTQTQTPIWVLNTLFEHAVEWVFFFFLQILFL